MATFGDLERAAGHLYEYRFAIAAAVALLGAATLTVAYRHGWHRAIARHPVPSAAIGAPLLVIGLFLLWSLASPLFTNVTVDEDFPYAAAATVPPGMERADVELTLAGMAMVNDPVMEEAMPSAAVINAEAMLAGGGEALVMDAEHSAALAEGYVMAAEGEVAQGLTMMAPAAQEAQQQQQGSPRQVATGTFRDADSFHRGSGQALIYAAPLGGSLLRLENLEVTNGPALHVILSPHRNPARGDETLAQGFIDLGPLKGNRGNQNYPIPADADLEPIQSVVIYCKPFAVVFSVASLTRLE